jgi:hypothetical protein
MANSTEEKIKAYLTPILITCFGVVSWSVITEIRADVKALLQSNAQLGVRVGELERRMTNVEYSVSDRLFAIKPDEIKVTNEKNPHH